MTHHVFVLSGGSVMGAFQVGELVRLTSLLPENDAVSGLFGVSVGSLNSAFLADSIGKAGASTPTIRDLNTASFALEKFWIQQEATEARPGSNSLD